jgi:predicted nuclease of restriction endonuclease-like (RecB) superfamily
MGIVVEQQKGEVRAGYGKATLKNLSEKLIGEFGRGYSRTNLEYMRKFYLTYQAVVEEKSQTPSGISVVTDAHHLFDSARLRAISQTLSGNWPLSWSHYLFLMGISNLEERRFYELEADTSNWSLRELRRQFDTSLYERLALSKDRHGVKQIADKGQLVERHADLIKNPYVLEFLGLDEKSRYSETQLETAIIDKLEHFLLELGKGFLFEARQRRFCFAEEHFYVDLVFYNRLLRCYVLIDLKIGELKHQDLGQMQMYVNYFDRFVKLEEELATIGIILCKKKNDSLVEITLPKEATIHAAKYQTWLPDKEELKRQLEEAQAEWEQAHPDASRDSAKDKPQ